jgi:two-component system OmpR family response regulator
VSRGAILLVEDDTGIGRVLESGLAAEGYAPVWRRDLKGAVEAAKAQTVDLIVLDRMLPDGDGADLCRALRRLGVAAPVLMLTARDTLEDKLSGFDAGADDYLTKPFEFDELLARLDALSRRGAPPPLTLELDPERRTMRWAARTATLTPREWPLIAYLAERPGRAVSRAELIERAWALGGQVTENSVDVYIGYLRRKLAAIDAGVRIETVRGAGFALVD